MPCLSVGGVQPGASWTPTLNKGNEDSTKTDPQSSNRRARQAHQRLFQRHRSKSAIRRSSANGRSWRNTAVPGVRGVFRSWMKSRLSAGGVVCLRTALSGALPGLCQARRVLYRPHININPAGRRTNRLFLANMSMSSPAFTSDSRSGARSRAFRPSPRPWPEPSGLRACGTSPCLGFRPLWHPRPA